MRNHARQRGTREAFVAALVALVFMGFLIAGSPPPVNAIEFQRAPVQPVQRIPGPIQTTPNALPKPSYDHPNFTSMAPSPLQLRAATMTQFTITGTRLDFVTSIELINSQTPVWILPASIVSRTSTTITAKVFGPKYLINGPYLIRAMTNTGIRGTGLVAQANENKPSSVWTEFNPILHGFSFRNGTWEDVCYTTVGGHLEYKQDGPFCGSFSGLCGGMSLNAGERFRSGIIGTHDLTKDAAKHALVDAQFRTLDGPTVAKFFEWMYSPDEGHATNPYHSVGYRMAQDWNGPIKQQLDLHKPVVLGLVFDKMATLFSQLDPTNVKELLKQHQVLGIGYSRIGTGDVRIVAYDPNFPDDILILYFTGGKTGVAQSLDSGRALPSTRRPVRGVMFIRSLP